MGYAMIRPATENDAAEIAAIYNHYVLNTAVSFEEEAVSVEEMGGRIREKMKSHPWIVYVSRGEILGYAYAGQWKERAAYRHTVEDTVYVKPGETGRGIGWQLLGCLLEALAEDPEVHAIMAVIALPNDGSVRLHEDLGFGKAAHFSEVGFKFGRWIDVGYWELILGRRCEGRMLGRA
ncbi:MAG TPA: GNAT family N-acetyltransferase [Rectinemataceae bacterium]